MLNSMDEIIAAANGGESPYWFSEESMAWFNTLLCSKVYPVADGAYFVTGERSGSEPRKWTVRFCSDDGSIENIGTFQQYEDAKAAHWAARGAAQAIIARDTDHS